ncbi:hypothetical protein TcWFU_007255 [Taenia crassiceps]|uniref:Uncharacterized protein n=1 Tax=Taenia crassiceps TaxID=6207 RepID=A0ABR4Q0P0_9CEST
MEHWKHNAPLHLLTWQLHTLTPPLHLTVPLISYSHCRSYPHPKPLFHLHLQPYPIPTSFPQVSCSRLVLLSDINYASSSTVHRQVSDNPPDRSTLTSSRTHDEAVTWRALFAGKNKQREVAITRHCSSLLGFVCYAANCDYDYDCDCDCGFVVNVNAFVKCGRECSSGLG